MVTGDQQAIAVETCRRLGMGTNIMEGKELMSHATEDLSFAKKVNALQVEDCTNEAQTLVHRPVSHVGLAMRCCLLRLLCMKAAPPAEPETDIEALYTMQTKLGIGTDR